MAPLRYSITSWEQLPRCISNTSRDLKINIKHILHDRRLQGKILELNHVDFGTIFSCPIDCQGDLVYDEGSELSTSAVLAVLRNFGFEIEYKPERNLDGDQLKYLVTLNELGFEKLRVLNVQKYTPDGRVAYKPYLVAFKIENNSDWLRNTYTPFEVEFLGALKHGTAMNITAISEDRHFNWDWLTYVADINDILTENTREGD